MRKPRTHMSEDQLHRQVVRYLRVALPDNAVFHHSPNESRGTKAHYIKRAAMGVRAGWPDIEIVWQGRTIFIELKSKVGRVTKVQTALHRELMLAGAVVKVCRSLIDVDDFLKQIMPMKGKLDG